MEEKNVLNGVSEAREKYPENVRAAIEWWADVVQLPEFNDGGATEPIIKAMLYGNRSGHFDEKMNSFKDSLAKDILVELQEYGVCSLSVDYYPCEILSRAGEKIGLNDLTGYPYKTRMKISNEVVEVSKGYGAPKETIWSSEKRETFEETPGSNHIHR